MLVRHHRRPASLPAAIALPVAVALLAAACGSPSSSGSIGSPGAGRSAASPSAVAYSHCMRSKGVPNYPDPPSNGRFPKVSAPELGVSGAQLQAAQRACQRLLPATGGSLATSFEQCVATGNCPQALVQRVENLMRKFALCMRSHGVPSWPDPTIGPGGAPFFNGSAHGINDHSMPTRAKINECERLSPAPVLFG